MSETNFLPGNSYWRLRSTHGRPKIFETPEDLLAACNNYFEFVENNPLIEGVLQKVKTDQHTEKVKVYSLPKMRPMTIHGLCNYIDMSVETFHQYEKLSDFSEVCTRVRQIIYNQKFEGAAAGFFNHAIIARDLGLVEKSEKTVIQEQPLFTDEPNGDE